MVATRVILVEFIKTLDYEEGLKEWGKFQEYRGHFLNERYFSSIIVIGKFPTNKGNGE